jgi:hypothetical protein
MEASFDERRPAEDPAKEEEMEKPLTEATERKARTRAVKLFMMSCCCCMVGIMSFLLTGPSRSIAVVCHRGATTTMVGADSLTVSFRTKSEEVSQRHPPRLLSDSRIRLKVAQRNSWGVAASNNQ